MFLKAKKCCKGRNMKQNVQRTLNLAIFGQNLGLKKRTQVNFGQYHSTFKV